MSFIYENNDLIDLLLKAGNQSLQKEAQQASSSGSNGAKNKIVSALPDYNLALKLLYKLQRDLADPNAPPAGTPINVQDNLNAKVEANTANFRTLGDFLTWAANNKLTWKGQRISFTPEEVLENRKNAREKRVDDPSAGAWTFTSLPYNRDDRNIDRQPIRKSVWAHKEPLIEYLSSLRDSTEAKKNNVLKFMVATLIGEVNGHLRFQNEQPISTKPTPETKVDIEPSMVIDVLPPVFTQDNIFEGIDNHPFQNIDPNNPNALTVENLKNETNFKAWLGGRKIKLPVPNTDKTDKIIKYHEVGVLHHNGDPCSAIHFLYRRARHLKNNALGDDLSVPNYSKGVAFYYNAIINYGRNLKDPGTQQSCSVTQLGTSATDPNKDKGTGESGKLTPGSKVTTDFTEKVNNVSRYVPLRLTSINTHDINAFFDQFETLLAPSSPLDQEIRDHHATVTSKMLALGGTLIKPSMTSFAFSGGVESVVGWLKNPRKDYSSFVQALIDIIDATNSAMEIFNTAYGVVKTAEDRPVLSDTNKSIVAGQLQIFKSNMRNLRGWMSEVPKVQGFKK